MLDWSVLPNRPRFVYGAADYSFALPARAWTPATATVGGRMVAAAGVPAAYVVRTDQLFSLPVRVRETEWDQLVELAAWGQLAESFLWYPDANEAENYQVYLESPVAGEGLTVVRSAEFPSVMECTLVFRRVAEDEDEDEDGVQALVAADAAWSVGGQVADCLYPTVGGAFAGADGDTGFGGGAGGPGGAAVGQTGGDGGAVTSPGGDGGGVDEDGLGPGGGAGPTADVPAMLPGDPKIYIFSTDAEENLTLIETFTPAFYPDGGDWIVPGGLVAGPNGNVFVVGWGSGGRVHSATVGGGGGACSFGWFTFEESESVHLEFGPTAFGPDAFA